MDIVGHPEQAGRGITLIPGDICEEGICERVGNIIAASEKEVKTSCCAGGLVVLSYCLDRVPDQQKAIHNFVRIMDMFEGGRGLITVCLPAVSTSPGSDIHYDHGTWITTGEDPIKQFKQIRGAVVREKIKAEIEFMGGGLTTHYGVSLADGYEELPCYVLWFSNGSKRISWVPKLSHGWIGEQGALTRSASEPWQK